jgi:hypothetical protein
MDKCMVCGQRKCTIEQVYELVHDLLKFLLKILLIKFCTTLALSIVEPLDLYYSISSGVEGIKILTRDV